MKRTITELLKMMSAMGAGPGLQAGLKKLGANGEFSIHVPGISSPAHIRKGTSDWTAFKQVFIWKEYEYPVPFAPKTILDAGSNVGFAALWFARKFPEAKIVSLEPETSNFDMLKKNTATYHNIQPIKAGLWGRSCYVRIIPTDWGNWGFRTEETEVKTEDSIKAISIKEIMDENKWETIDLMKMDIEGAERNVFSSNASDWLPKTKMIFLELHDNIHRECSKAVFKALLDYDFRVDISGENLILINNNS